MVRIVIEVSLPESTLPRIRSLLASKVLPEGARGHIEEALDTGLCAGLARGGPGRWMPCLISIQFPDGNNPACTIALRELRSGLVDAARTGGMELVAIPTSVQDGDEFLRVKDLDGVLSRFTEGV